MERPARTAPDVSRRLWLANQLCDLVQIRTCTTGTVVHFVMRHRVGEVRSATA